MIEEGQKFTFSNFSFPNESGRQYGGPDTPEWNTWKIRSFNVIREAMSDESPARNLVQSGIDTHTNGYYADNFNFAKDSIMKALSIALKSIEDDVFDEARKHEAKSSSKVLSNKIFVVHGHDDNLKVEVENFVTEIGLEPVVLHRQPDQGQTIIEKFEKHSDVGFAFILLTPDEVAYLADQETLEDSKRKKEWRARPNVIFEFGYFVGRLGRERVCCLYKGDVTLPSDLSGLLYKRIASTIDAEGISILRELKAAGYQVRI